jgi:hypothetical protein
LTTNSSDVLKFDLWRSAESALGQFLAAVDLVFGNGWMARATDLWLEEFEAAEGFNADREAFFEKVAIRASSRLAIEMHASQSFEFEAKK